MMAFGDLNGNGTDGKRLESVASVFMLREKHIARMLPQKRHLPMDILIIAWFRNRRAARRANLRV
jgi:hypothetical protein